MVRHCFGPRSVAALGSAFAAALILVTLPSTGASAAPGVGLATVSVPRGDIGEVTAFVERNPTRFSGIYFERVSNQYVITLPNGADLASGLHAATAFLPAFPAVGPLVTVSAQHRKRTIAQLHAIEDDVAAGVGEFGAKAGRSVLQWGLDEKDNVVVVGVPRITPALVSAAQATYGDSVRLKRTTQHYAASKVTKIDHVNVIRVPAASRTSAASAAAGSTPGPTSLGPSRQKDTQPYWAGDRLVYVDSKTLYITECTNGWNSGVVRGRQTGNSFVFTAGHCFPGGAAVDQGYYDSSLGAAVVTGEVGPVNAVQWGNNRPDWESVNPSIYSRIAETYYVGAVDDATGVDEYDMVSAALGEPVCADGSFTGESCNGTVSATDGCENLSYDNAGHTYLVCHLDFASSSGPRLVQHGDSGGPVIGYDGQVDTGITVGVISAGNVGTEANPGPGTEMEFTDGGTICSISNEC